MRARKKLYVELPMRENIIYLEEKEIQSSFALMISSRKNYDE